MHTNDPTLTAEHLAAAKVAYAQTVENHAAVLETATRARHRHTAASAQRARLLDTAAAGAPVDEAALERADADTAAALNTWDLHRSIAAGAQTRGEQAEVEVLHAQVADHAARTHTARVAAVEAATAVDQAIDAARARLADYQARLADLRALGDEGNDHNNHVLPLVISRNAILDALPSNQRPKAVAVPIAQSALTILILANQRPGHLEGARIVPSLIQHTSGLAPKTPATPSKAA
jgi:hypothetical protein